ncbi:MULTISPECIES: ATP-binding cassette domain-containing protein [Kitasatospora]|uniref:ATP-binding cassette domain-containing protein n=1 Tax=Kitasatospora TaxID=2063 RepID=UPI000C712C95|nr:ATP-binding cassette domain-containing protein [Kitasatospora sp. GP30]MDH6145760.1 oleandomycin transport system ATP-binding protein [Kitasatospora sp. GP30]
MTPLPNADDPAVAVQGLVKRYGGPNGVTALAGVDLAVRRGTVLGVLGANGAGKTTLVRILCTLVRPDAGTVTVGGHDVLRRPKEVRRMIGLTGQYAAVDGKLPGRETLYLIGRLLDLGRKEARARADELLERFSLTDAAGRAADTYSGGMRRRLDLAASMVGRPAVLFLDEPTTGLDPRSRNEVWDEVRGMAQDGTAVLLTTQYMEEAEQLASELTVIDGGKVVAAGPVDELKAEVGGRTLRIRPGGDGQLERLVKALKAAELAPREEARLSQQDGVLAMPVRGEEHLTAVIALLGAEGIPVAEIDTSLPSLDEVFLTLTGKPAESGQAESREAVRV